MTPNWFGDGSDRLFVGGIAAGRHALPQVVQKPLATLWRATLCTFAKPAQAGPNFTPGSGSETNQTFGPSFRKPVQETWTFL